MGGESISRRHFMQGSGAAAGSSLLRLTAPVLAAAAQAACSARDEGAAFRTLSAAEALELEAIAARILPTTTTPGAREAGVIYFFDNVLGAQMAGMLGGIRGTLPSFQEGITQRFAGSERFSDLSEADQDAWLSDQQRTPLFSMVYPLTLMGFFAMGKYGGNKDRIGWDLIDFEGHGATQPPFGYYDAEYVEEKRNGD
jgi:gluconate 2-dehydrogenase gamma chain